MKLVILLFSIFCYSIAIPIFDYGTGRKITVSDTGSICLISPISGKEILIDKKTDSIGRRFIEITITGPNFPTKKFRINDDSEFMDDDTIDYPNDTRMKRDFKKFKITQGDLVINIFKQYQGSNIDDITYLHLLNKIGKAVEKGMIHEIIYYLIENLDQIGEYNLEPYFIGHHEIIPSIYGTTTFGQPIGRINPLNLITNRGICGNLDLITCMKLMKYGFIQPHNIFPSTMGLDIHNRGGVGGIFGNLGLETQLQPILHDTIINRRINEIPIIPGVFPKDIGRIYPSNMGNILGKLGLTNSIYQPHMFEKRIFGGRGIRDLDLMNTIMGIPQPIL